MPDRGVRPWVEPAVRPVPEPLVAEVWDAESGILARLTYRQGREAYEPAIRRPAAAAADEGEDG
jgi:hypothetical protein